MITAIGYTLRLGQKQTGKILLHLTNKESVISKKYLYSKYSF